MPKNQIDVAVEVEEILANSGLEYGMAYNPDEHVYYFKLTNIDSENDDVDGYNPDKI